MSENLAPNEHGGAVGPKVPVTAEKAVCASQHPIVTNTMLQVMKDGGNAVDAAIAGCLVQATVQQDMTNHTGTVTFLYYEAKTGKTYQLNSMGTIVGDLPPFRQVPPGSMYTAYGAGPFAVIPGFMPGMKAMFERFATKPWDYLCQSAIKWAEEGHTVNSFEHLVIAQTVDFYLYTQSGRDHFLPDGFLPQVGQRWPKPELTKTLKRLAQEGPDEFISGEWARQFVERANQLGWKIEMQHMDAMPPRWQEPKRYKHREYEIVQLAPPERQAVFSAIVLGILDALNITSFGHYSESAEALYYFAQALRRANIETGALYDPETFEDPTDVLMSPEYHQMLARILLNSKPKVDLTKHVQLTAGPNALRAAGVTPEQPAGSCELSIVDSDGNWVQMMNTLQSGGIPGEVVGGVPMVGSHAMTHMLGGIAGWFGPGGRMRSVIGNTMVFKEGKPWLALGTPGNVHCTVPQVLSNILDYGMEPYAAIDAPRMLPIEEDYKISIESRIAPSVVADLAKLGVLIKPLPTYDYHMGTFQTSWRDQDGKLHSTAGPRRAGIADGF